MAATGHAGQGEGKDGTMAIVTTLPHGLPLTRADLDAMPDDGHRYELIDGALIVTPAPSVGHQFSVGRLHLLLAAACPPDMVVLFAPLDVALAADTVMRWLPVVLDLRPRRARACGVGADRRRIRRNRPGARC